MKEKIERLLQSIDYLKDKGKIHKQQDIVESMGINKGNLSKALKGDPAYLTGGFLKRFAEAYKDFINPEWLVNGVGEMETPDKSKRPFVDIQARAGFIDDIASGSPSVDFYNAIVGIPDYDFTVKAYGDSMLPVIHDGDILACRRTTDRLSISPTNIYVFDTKNGMVVKCIAGASDDEVLLHSLNPAYPDYSVAADSVLGVARVIGVVHSLL